MMLITPSRWTLTEASREVRLPALELHEPRFGVGAAQSIAVREIAMESLAALKCRAG